MVPADACPEPAGLRPVPWEDPALPRLTGFGRTLAQLLFHPEDFFHNLGPGGRAEPFAFGLIAGSLGLLGSLFWYLLLAGATSRETLAVSGETLGSTAGLIFCLMSLAPALILARMVLGRFSLWVGAALLEQQASFTQAWRLYCYVQGVVVVALIPLFGLPLAAMWTLLLLYRGIRGVWQTAAPAALAALALFLGLQVLLAMILCGTAAALTGLGGFLLFLGS